MATASDVDPAAAAPASAVDVPVVVIGGGQAGLATGFYLQRAGLTPDEDFVVLDAADEAGGAWPRMWEGLRLFSPAQYSSLPGKQMPAWNDGYPPAEHVRAYLAEYEKRYDLSVHRPVRVRSVERDRPEDGAADRPLLLVHADDRTRRAQAVVSATGTWERPFWPAYPGAADFAGTQLHSSTYRRPEDFAGQRVVVVGGGNTAAQVLAEVSRVAETTWVTAREPHFMPDHVDGRHLFAAATRRVRSLGAGDGADPGVGGLGDIVMVPPVREARDRGVLRAEPMFARLTRDGIAWSDGSTHRADAVIWCTGFRPALEHLRPLRLRDRRGRIDTGGAQSTRSVAEPRLHLIGYGDWTGPASATLIGVGRTARDAASEIVESLTPAGSSSRPREPRHAWRTASSPPGGAFGDPA